MNVKFSHIIAVVSLLSLSFTVNAQQHGEPHNDHSVPTEQHNQEAVPAEHAQHHGDSTTTHHMAEGHEVEHIEGVGADGKYDPKPMIFEHIGNSNEFHLWGHTAIPLPCLLWSKEDGLTTCLSSKFEHGHKAFNRYVLHNGVVKRIADASFPTGEIEIGHIKHTEVEKTESDSLFYEGKMYAIEKASKIGAFTSWYDFSISKNVFTMLLVGLLLCLIFFSVAKAYANGKGKAPRGLQGFIEPILVFLDSEVIQPMLGDRSTKFAPYIYVVFFFILFNNLIGLIPIFPGGSNVTGNISTTMVLALFTFLLTNLNGNREYWGHIFNMPGVPAVLKLLITPVEIIGVFTKPISLMIRLFANITAGHIIILNLVSLIFVFGRAGESMLGAGAGIALAVPFTLFMNVIELVVALIQAFIFSILTASYIGAATESHHH
ncbi:MAG: F0F1 ATP synthase subunit A [Saprospiraceae bacterium]